MSKSAISVALCTYNAAHYCEEELNSIACQSRLPNEIVICDDGSNDDTLEILERFAKKAPFPTRILRNESRLGSTKNFEKAISLCAGELIALADFDDIWQGDKLEQLSAALEKNPGAGYVFSDGEMVSADGAPTGSSMWRHIPSQSLLLSGFPPESQVPALLKHPVVTGATMMIRTAIREVVLPISPVWVHDYWISLLSSFVGLYGVAVPSRLTKYRSHPGQLIGLGKPILKRSRLSLAAPAERWHEHLQAFQDLRDRLLGDAALLRRCKPRELALLDQKLLHVEQRLSAGSSTGFKKFRIVLGEVCTGRYRQFSKSWQSIGRDLCP